MSVETIPQTPAPIEAIDFTNGLGDIARFAERTGGTLEQFDKSNWKISYANGDLFVGGRLTPDSSSVIFGGGSYLSEHATGLGSTMLYAEMVIDEDGIKMVHRGAQNRDHVAGVDFRNGEFAKFEIPTSSAPVELVEAQALALSRDGAYLRKKETPIYRPSKTS